jgi:hypothetical protein
MSTNRLPLLGCNVPSIVRTKNCQDLTFDVNAVERAVSPLVLVVYLDTWRMRMTSNWMTLIGGSFLKRVNVSLHNPRLQNLFIKLDKELGARICNPMVMSCPGHKDIIMTPPEQGCGFHFKLEDLL